jgi:hypothetical protein
LGEDILDRLRPLFSRINDLLHAAPHDLLANVDQVEDVVVRGLRLDVPRPQRIGGKVLVFRYDQLRTGLKGRG